MADPMIHDRGRGPELIGTRITVYDLLPFLLDARNTEAWVCEFYHLRPEQVAAVRAYALANHAAVMAEHERMDERSRRAVEAQDTPEFRAARAETRERMELFRAWMAERTPADLPADPAERMAAFRRWAAARPATPAGA